MEITPEVIKHLPTAERQRIERQLHLTPPPNEHRVFVYGTLLSGEGNAQWARGARRHPAWTHGTIYDTGFGFPAFVRDGDKKIAGELLAVDDEGFRSMDRLEGYPRLYRREEIEVYPECGGRVRAWVYIMNSLPKDAKVIESGNWRTRSRG